MSQEIKGRNEIDKIHQWDIESMYQNRSLWEKDLSQSLELARELAEMEGTLTRDATSLLKALTHKDRLWQQLERVFVYSRMKRDEDNENQESQEICDQAMSAISQVTAMTSYITPELLAAGEEVLLGYLKECPDLEVYRFYLMNILREKDHVLAPKEENILAQLGEVTSATNDIFTMLNNADMNFGEIEDEKGKLVPLTHGNYITFMESPHREVRQRAYNRMYESYRNLINTLATTYNYNTKNDVVSARIRHYPSSLEMALSPDHVDPSVYHNLIEVVEKNLPALHRYMEARKRLLGVEELKMHDVYVPLVPLKKQDIPYEKGVAMIKEALAVLGDDYLKQMEQGLSSGWVDVYENRGKTSGAYSFGSYDSKPFILLNYTNTLKDVFTLIHEMGHSMHSAYTRAHQPFIYGGHSIFTAEVASTVNENLLMKHLLKKETDPEMKKYLLNLHIEEFRTTLFRQTMFAKFEAMTHQAVEDGIPLTGGWLCQEYEKLNRQYFGPALGEDPYIQYEWARIPHFYRAFYVYKYATGYSAAAAISDLILAHGPESYLEFLKTGEKDHPIELLKIAGVDMASPQPIEAAMDTFGQLVDEFISLVESDSSKESIKKS